MNKVYLIALAKHPILVGLSSVIGVAITAYLAFLVLSVLISLFVMVLPYAIALAVVAGLIRFAYIYGKHNH